MITWTQVSIVEKANINPEKLWPLIESTYELREVAIWEPSIEVIKINEGQLSIDVKLELLVMLDYGDDHDWTRHLRKNLLLETTFHTISWTSKKTFEALDFPNCTLRPSHPTGSRRGSRILNTSKTLKALGHPNCTIWPSQPPSSRQGSQILKH